MTVCEDILHSPGSANAHAEIIDEPERDRERSGGHNTRVQRSEMKSESLTPE